MPHSDGMKSGWPPESRIRNWLLTVSAFLTFCAVGYGYGWVAWGLAFVTVFVLYLAVQFGRPRALFPTDRPDDWPPGTRWRRFTVSGVAPLGGDSWVVLGYREW